MSGEFTAVTRELVRRRAGDRCEVCWYTTDGLQFHHRRPRGMGSSRKPETSSASNCLLVCRDCHAMIESQRTVARERGWLLRQRQTPNRVPVWWNLDWVLLDDDGGTFPASPKGGAGWPSLF